SPSLVQSRSILLVLIQAIQHLILCSPDTQGTSYRKLLNHLLDTVGTGFQVAVDLFQRARWLEYIEMPVEGNLETDNAYLTIQRICLAFIDPGVGYMGFYLALEVVVYRLTQGDVLVITQAAVGFRFALGHADIRLGVALAEGVEQGPEFRCAGEDVMVGQRLFQQFAELLAIAVHYAGVHAAQRVDQALLCRGCHFLDGLFRQHFLDALGAGLEVQAQRALDGDAAVAEGF